MTHYETLPDYRVLSERTLRAKKDYTCTICKKPILKGYPYRKVAALYDGKFVCDRFHPGIGLCMDDYGDVETYCEEGRP